jgi:hypothetical protein
MLRGLVFLDSHDVSRKRQCCSGCARHLKAERTSEGYVSPLGVIPVTKALAIVAHMGKGASSC